jgi:hypothetical protein
VVATADLHRRDYFKPDFFNGIGQIERLLPPRLNGSFRFAKAVPGCRLLTTGTFETGSKAMIDDIEYRGFRLMLMVNGTGWRVFIYGPNSKLLEGEMPSTTNPAGRTAVIDEARQIVDRLLHSN